MRALLRVLLIGAGLLLALGATLGAWVLLRPVGWVYALAGSGAVVSALLGAGSSLRGSAWWRDLLEDR